MASEDADPATVRRDIAELRTLAAKQKTDGESLLARSRSAVRRADEMERRLKLRLAGDPVPPGVYWRGYNLRP